MALPESREEFQTFFDRFTERLGFDDVVTTLGLKPHDAGDGSISMSMELRDEIAQASGMYSAAALFGAADITGTLLTMQAYVDKGQFPLAVQSSQNFISNSKADKAIATAKLLRVGGSMAVAEVEVKDSEDKLLMFATFTYILKERKLGR